MDADFAVELGPDDATLEIPWSLSSASAPASRYFDLKRQPESLAELEEAQAWPEVAGFLAAMNSPAFAFETAKCDVWSTTEMTVEDEIFEAAWKFASYVDLLFTDTQTRSSFPAYEQFATRLTHLLKRTPEISASSEFLIRRVHFHVAGEIHEGFYFTFYLFGFGEDEDQARQHWAIGLKLVENAICQLM